MAGMYFELFIIMTLIIAGLLLSGTAWRRAWPFLLATIFMILTGAVLMSDGLRVEVGSTYDSTTGVLTYDYNSLMPSNDLTVLVFADSYFYGGFLLAIVAGGLLVWGRVAGVDQG